jgi:hypothetical protein
MSDKDGNYGATGKFSITLNDIPNHLSNDQINNSAVPITRKPPFRISGAVEAPVIRNCYFVDSK